MSEPQTRSTWEDPLKALASYLNQAEGLDQTWKHEGLCRQYAAGERYGFQNWMSDYRDNIEQGGTAREKRETEKAAMALMICANCPVQYDCAGFGAKTDATAGIFGVRTSSLKWLRRYGKGGLLDKLLDEGRRSGQPVEVFVMAKREFATKG